MALHAAHNLVANSVGDRKHEYILTLARVWLEDAVGDVLQLGFGVEDVGK